jgi:tetraacyldisaccharide 4'-kinase
LNEESLRKLISGQNRGVIAVILRFILNVTAWIYTAVIQLRDLFYSKGWRKTHRVNAAVISIGNITTGGTGKTPLVIWLYNTINQKSKIKNQKCGVAILTRGYKATQNFTDEPAILTQSCPQAKLIINPDRVQGAIEAIDMFNAKVLVMDDGFQHRRLARDLDIVTIDALQPFGYGRTLPAGLLREPLSALKRADAAIITRCNQVDEAELVTIEEKLKQTNPNIAIARTIHAPVCVRYPDDREISIEELKSKNVFAFCGIGNPHAFLNTIKSLGANLIGTKIYNDHYSYTNENLADICERAKQLYADLILTTQKDWTKITLSSLTLMGIPFAYLEIELQFIRGEDKIRQLIEKALAGKITTS